MIQNVGNNANYILPSFDTLNLYTLSTSIPTKEVCDAIKIAKYKTMYN
jgi:hypothetical protein